MERDPAVWTTGDGKELPREGSGYRGKEHVLLRVEFGSGFEMDGRVGAVSQPKVELC